MTDDIRYETWLTEVEHRVQAGMGAPIRLRDLPDHPYKVWWDDLVEPDEAAAMVLEAGL